MPPKKSSATPGVKLLHAYWLLLFSPRKYSLSEIMEELECSKSNALNIMTQLESSGFANIESWIEKGRRWYRLNAPKNNPRVSLTQTDIMELELCRELVCHMLPEKMRDRVFRAIGHASVLTPEETRGQGLPSGVGLSRPKGGIDYSDKEGELATLMEAIRGGIVCKVHYRSPEQAKTRIHYAAPFKLISHNDGLYVNCWRLKEGGNPKRVTDITFAVHRIEKVEKTLRTFSQKIKADDSKGFGLIEGDPFQCVVEFSERVAQYVKERTWSRNQVVTPLEDGSVVLEFTAASWHEVRSWIMSFGPYAKVLAPPDMVDEIKAYLDDTRQRYE